jgi:hypothetical protein
MNDLKLNSGQKKRLLRDSARRVIKTNSKHVRRNKRHSNLYIKNTGRCSKGVKKWGKTKIIYVYS